MRSSLRIGVAILLENPESPRSLAVFGPFPAHFGAPGGLKSALGAVLAKIGFA